MNPRTSAYSRFYCVSAANSSGDEVGRLRLSESQQQRFVALARSVFLQQLGIVSPPDPSGEDLDALPAYPVHVAFRIGGRYWSEGIAAGSGLRENVVAATTRAFDFRRAILAELPRRSQLQSTDSEVMLVDGAIQSGVRTGADPPDATLFPDATSWGFSSQDIGRLGIELTLFHNAYRLQRRDREYLESTIQLGIHGLGLIAFERLTLFSNSKAIIHNYRHQSLLERLSESLGLPGDAYCDEQHALYRFDTQHLVERSPSDRIRTLFRCDEVVQVDELCQDRVETFLRRAGGWMLNSVRADGRMEYKYMPSRGEYQRRQQHDSPVDGHPRFGSSISTYRGWSICGCVAAEPRIQSRTLFYANGRLRIHLLQRKGEIGCGRLRVAGLSGWAGRGGT